MKPAGEHDLAGLLAGGSDTSEASGASSEEPPRSEQRGAGAKGEVRSSPASRRGGGSPARPPAAPTSQRKTGRADVSGVPCTVCHKPGHMGSHCPTREAERAENDRRVLELREAERERAAAAAAGEQAAAPGERAAEGTAAAAKTKSRSRERSRERKKARSREPSRERERPRSSRERKPARSRERERERERSREHKPARDKETGGRAERRGAAPERRSRERSREAVKRRRSRSRSRSPPASEAKFRNDRETFASVLEDAKRLKHAADAAAAHVAPKLMLQAVLRYLDSAAMQESQVRASGNEAAGEQLAMLLMQTSTLSEFAGTRADELLRGNNSNAVAVELRLVRLLAMRLCICCVSQATTLRRAALRTEAEAAAKSTEGSVMVQQRMAQAVLDAVRLGDLWERAGAAAIDAAAKCNASRSCTEAYTFCGTVASAAGGYGELRQVRTEAKRAFAALGKLDLKA